MPISDYRTAYIVNIGFSAFKKFASALSYLSNEILRVLPSLNPENITNMLCAHSVKDRLDVTLRVRDTLSSYHSLKDFISLTFTRVVYNARAIDEINAFSQSDVLPYFGLARNWSHLAASLLHERIDNTTLADVGVPNEAD